MIIMENKYFSNQSFDWECMRHPSLTGPGILFSTFIRYFKIGVNNKKSHFIQKIEYSTPYTFKTNIIEISRNSLFIVEMK